MADRRTRINVDPSHGMWAVAVVFVAAVAMPTACVLWFMTQAMRNDHLAVRETLTRTYQDRLEAARKMGADEVIDITKESFAARVDDLTEGGRRDERRVHTLEPLRDDLARQREVSLAEELRLLEELEGWAAKHLLIQELILLHPPEPGQLELALREVREEALAEEDDCRP